MLFGRGRPWVLMGALLWSVPGQMERDSVFVTVITTTVALLLLWAWTDGADSRLVSDVRLTETVARVERTGAEVGMIMWDEPVVQLNVV